MLTQELINDYVVQAHGDFEKMKALLAEHPNLLNQSAAWDETAIGAAAHMARLDIVNFLLEQGAPHDVFVAIVRGEKERFMQYLDEDPELVNGHGPHGLPVFFYPAIVGNTEFGGLLLARGADVNAGAGGMTAMHGAAQFGQSAYAEWLAAKGADVNAQNYMGKTPLETALEAGHAEMADVLRKLGAVE